MNFKSCDYTIVRVVNGPFAAAVAATRSALATEGFGVLTEIDVQATLATKLGVAMRPYLILGACNPALAHRALEAEPGIGALLPCNVVLVENDDDTIAVAAVDPVAMFAVVANPALAPIVADVKDRLARVIAAVAGGAGG